MTRRPKILYAGSYERDYPRNQQVIRLLRACQCDVTEIHEPFWERIRDKSRLPGGGLSLVMIAARLLVTYLRLLIRTAPRIRSADALAIGYIGQLDMLVLGLLARISRIPVLYNPLVTLTDTIVEDRAMTDRRSLASRLIWVVDWLALRNATLILSDTEENATYLTAQFGISRSRIYPVPVGADEEMFALASNRGDRSPGIQALFYGKMIPLHGIETILEAIRILYESGDEDISFEIIGSGQQEHLVRAFVESHPGISLVHRRWVAYRRLPQRIASADVVLGIFGATEKASRVVPNKVFQAMAAGAAIITRDSPAIREVLSHGSSALLTPPADADALAEAIRSLRNAELRTRLSEGARASFERTGSDHALMPGFSSALDALLSSGSDSPVSRQSQ